MAEQRYRVVDRLEAGGMAEVFRGEALSVQGFRKQVAIKRVLPHLAQNENFIAMFLDEARLGARLNHANIVTVFDIGAADDTYFIVMEFVEGANLKHVMENLRKHGRAFPINEAAFVCIEACKGLSYAHEISDEVGQPLHIVHRDVSPPNILISRRGEVKLTDFGLAKATTQLEKTDPGVVKGKFSYLSPEAAMGQPVDARADVFALGVVLWEMLAGRRLFLGETDYQTVKLVQQAEVPSLRTFHAQADSEFDELLGRALARDPRQRYASAQDFGDALTAYIFKHQLKVTAYDIANLVKSTQSEHPKSPKVQARIDKLIQEELLSFTSLEEVSEDDGAETALSPESTLGAQPLDATLFENPADWFSEDSDVANALDEAAASAPPSRPPEWREAGRANSPDDLAALLEGDSTAPGQKSFRSPPNPSVRPGGQPSRRPGAAEPGAEPLVNLFEDPGPVAPTAPGNPFPTASVAAPPKKKGKGGAILLFILLLLIGAGAALWWLGLLPAWIPLPR